MARSNSSSVIAPYSGLFCSQYWVSMRMASTARRSRPPHALQLLAQQRVSLLVCDAIYVRELPGDRRVDGLSMVVVIRQRSVDLPQRQVRMLTLNLLGIPMMGDPVERDLDDFCPRALKKWNAVSGQFDVRVGNRRHGHIPRGSNAGIRVGTKLCRNMGVAAPFRHAMRNSDPSGDHNTTRPGVIRTHDQGIMSADDGVE